MNRQIRQLALALMSCYVVLFVALNYWQVGQKQELDAHFDNTRRVFRTFNQPRGPIITYDGVIAAQSVANTTDDRFEYDRVYPTNELLSGVTGYFTFAFGATQVEREYSDVLTGDTTAQQVRNLADLLSGEVDNTGTVQLAIRHDLQSLAAFLLGGRQGSVVVIEPKTGAIRAMWSYPSYDPNTFVNAPFEEGQEILTALQQAPGNPLLANAYQERYMPGSTFKVLTTGIGLENGVISPATVFPDEREWTPPQTTDPIQNYRGTLCGGDMETVFARSCNIPFAKTALDIGVDAMVEGVAKWGLGEPLPIDLPRPAASTFGDTDELDQALPLLAIRGFGQNEDQMVPLHMAMIAAAVANGGVMMQPYAIEATYDKDGAELDHTEPEVWKTPISSATAATLTQFMTAVAERGTASCCIGLAGGVSVAAKTGTAELGNPDNPDLVHAWIIAFAPVEDPQYAVAVVLNNIESTQDLAATGGRFAGPIAKGLLDYLLTGPGATGVTTGPDALPNTPRTND